MTPVIIQWIDAHISGDDCPTMQSIGWVEYNTLLNAKCKKITLHHLLRPDQYPEKRLMTTIPKGCISDVYFLSKQDGPSLKKLKKKRKPKRQPKRQPEGSLSTDYIGEVARYCYVGDGFK